MILDFYKYVLQVRLIFLIHRPKYLIINHEHACVVSGLSRGLAAADCYAICYVCALSRLTHGALYQKRLVLYFLSWQGAHSTFNYQKPRRNIVQCDVYKPFVLSMQTKTTKRQRKRQLILWN